MTGRSVVLLAVLLTGCEEALPPSPDAAEEAEGTPASPAPSPTGCADISAAEAGPGLVDMQDNRFAPGCFAISSTQGLQIANSGNNLHNFSIDEAVDVDVEPGERTTTDPLEDLVAPGTYDFVCKYHRGAGMVGIVIVE